MHDNEETGRKKHETSKKNETKRVGRSTNDQTTRREKKEAQTVLTEYSKERRVKKEWTGSGRK